MLFDDVKAFFKHHLTVGRPSVTAYALAIHALGCRGAVSDAVARGGWHDERGSMRGTSVQWRYSVVCMPCLFPRFHLCTQQLRSRPQAGGRLPSTNEPMGLDGVKGAALAF